MIISIRHIAAVLTVIAVCVGIKLAADMADKTVFNNKTDLKIVLDARHGVLVKCFNRRLV